LAVASYRAVVALGIFDGSASAYLAKSEIPQKDFGGLGDWAGDQVELVNAPLVIVALLAGKKKAPLLSIGENSHRYALMKRILEKLLLGTDCTANIFRFKEDDRALGWIAEGVINTACAEGELWNYVRRIEYLPSERLKKPQDDALRNSRLVRIATGSDSSLDVFYVSF
jgi:hypothetical protein